MLSDAFSGPTACTAAESPPAAFLTRRITPAMAFVEYFFFFFFFFLNNGLRDTSRMELAGA